MIIEYALLAGEAGIVIANIVNVKRRIDKQNKMMDIKENINNINTFRKKTMDSLVELGELKADCFKNEIKEFVESYFVILNQPNKTKAIEKARIQLNHEDTSELLEWVSDLCIGMGKWKQKYLEREIISIAVGTEDKWNAFPVKGPFYVVGGIIPAFAIKALRGSTYPNPTIAWITHPLFSDKVNIRDNNLVCNGDIGELVLAVTNYPHSMQTEMFLRKILKNEEKKKELGIEIEKACLYIDDINSIVTEIAM